MPVISLVSPKGGAGKSTAAILLATELAQRAEVVIIDADPNRPIVTWAGLPGKPANITVLDATQDNMLDRIDEARGRVPFVVVDTEGTASLTVAYAIGGSDLVIIPTQGSFLDEKQAARAIKLVKDAERQQRRNIPHAVVLTRTSPTITTRDLASVQQHLQGRIHVLDTQLNERAAFRSIFSFGGDLRSLDPQQVRNIDKAVANASEFAREAMRFLTESSKAATQLEKVEA